MREELAECLFPVPARPELWTPVLENPKASWDGRKQLISLGDVCSVSDAQRILPCSPDSFPWAPWLCLLTSLLAR